MLFGAKKIKCNVRYKDKKFIYELERQNTIKDIYNLFSKEESIPQNYSSLTIKLCSNRLPFNKEEFDTPLISFETNKFNELNFEITKPYNCSNCKKIISKYCLVCDKYFCPSCENKEHNKHDLVDIDPSNFQESIYLWNININANLSNDITHFNKLKDFVQDNVFGTKIKLWKDNVIKKLNTFEKFIKDICEVCNRIGKNYIEKKSEVLNKLMLDLSKTEQLINNELSIGPDSKSNNNNKYFSFDEAEVLIQKLKKSYNDIKSKNTDIKELFEIENVNNLNDIMGNISSEIDELSKNGYQILDSFKNFFGKFNNNNVNDNNSSISVPRFETVSNVNKINHNKISALLKSGNNLKSKIYCLELPKKSHSIAIKETTLSSKDSYSTCNKTNSKINQTKRIFNSFKKSYKNSEKKFTNLYDELNLSKIKLKVDTDDKDTFLYSDRYQRYSSLEKGDKMGFLPLITKI